MHVELLKSKIHEARITGTELRYEGSLAIDPDLLEQIGMLPYEKILVVNATNGQRLETYVITAPRGSREFILNGAAARCGEPGDIVTIMSFASVPIEEADGMKPRIVVLDEKNQVLRTRNISS